MTVLLLIGLGGGAGAIVRYIIDGVVQDRSSGRLPWGTLTINVAGSFLMGLVSGALLFRGAGGDLGNMLGPGFCGGMTTWSAASWETVQLIEQNQLRLAAVTFAGGTAASMVASAAGLLVARL